MRTVICHYHIYKNSGTSFDALLRKNFGERHLSFDGPFPFFTIDQEQLTRIIERKHDAVAFSSHQIQLPAPASLSFLALPVVFLRHPILRIRSIYNFKRKTHDGTETSTNACTMSFAEWIEHCIGDRREITHVSNAQTRLLGAAYRQRALMSRTDNGMRYDVHQAIRNLRTVPLLARTEYFDEDVARFPEILGRFGIEFAYTKMKPENTTTKNFLRPLEERLERVRELLGDTIYQKLARLNRQDLAVYQYASRLIEIDPALIEYVDDEIDQDE